VAGIRPQQVWAEMDRREKLLGLAEKLPKDLPKGGVAEPIERRKVVALKRVAFPSGALRVIDPPRPAPPKGALLLTGYRALHAPPDV